MRLCNCAKTLHQAINHSTMPESQTHKDLVYQLYKCAITGWMADDTTEVFWDSPERTRYTRPPEINGHRPDLWARNTVTGMLVIGEAKTANDLNSSHSADQIRMFLRKCSEEPLSLFILAVPWHSVPSARGLLRYIKTEAGLAMVDTIIINELGVK